MLSAEDEGMYSTPVVIAAMGRILSRNKKMLLVYGDFSLPA